MTTTKQIQEVNLSEYITILDKLRDLFYVKWQTEDKDKDNAKLEDFDRLRTIGTGGYGRVMLVRHKANSNYYAMKILRKAKLVLMKQVLHTLNEKKILLCINFPFVVHMEYYFKNNSYLYMIMPFVGGGEMFIHLRRLGKFPESLSRFYAAQVTLALEYMHHCKLIYRDLKPENILIDVTGYIKITDFGFCKMMTSGRTWTLCGTPEYLAPEIILSKGYGMAVDWWSFGILLYEMNAGYAPFYSHQSMNIYNKIIKGKYKRPIYFSEALNKLVLNLLQTDLTKRFGNLKDGTLDIKRDLWFKDMDWNKLYHQKLKPEFVPILDHEADTSNFEKYDEEEMNVNLKDQYANEFAGF